MKQRIREYDILRIILVLLVVIGHSAYLEIGTKYGGIYYLSQLYESGYWLSRAYNWFQNVVSFIYMFHMELFMLLSGTLFMYSFNKYGTKEFFVKKVKRLMIPFFVVMVFSILVKYLTGYWSNSSSIIKDIIYGQVLLNGNTHLWFLPTLLAVTIITWVLEKLRINKYIKLLLLVVLYFICPHISIPFINYIFKYLLWFNLGIFFEEYREKINENSTITNAILEFIIALLFYLVFLRCPGDKQIVLYPVITSFMILSVYSFAYNISKTKFELKVISDNSLEIYLVSDLINYIFLFFVFNCLPLSIFTSSKLSILIIGARFLLQLLLSLLIIKIYKKIKKFIFRKHDIIK